jgi:hypothetical protein
LLPDRWMAVVHSAGAVALTATSADIRTPLPVGPDPQAPAPDAETEAAIARGERLPIDEGMRWMTDFDEAESAGMALRIPVPAATLRAGLDSLVVFGVRRTADATDTAGQFAHLLDAHHYTDGLAFVRPGTPTNNTDDRRAGHGDDDPGHADSFDREVGGVSLVDDSNAQHTSVALGLSPDSAATALSRVERGRARDGAHMRSMNTALWSVGWGYFLSNMIGSDAGVTRADLEWARAHFLDHVRAFGPLPAMRLGPQPYGLLPVTSLDLWKATDEAAPQETWLTGMLIALRDRVWRPAATSVARIGNRQDPPDPDADLADVMRTDALSHRYAARQIVGRHFLQHLSRFLGSDVVDSDAAQLALLRILGVDWRPRLSRTWQAGWERRVVAPLVQDGEASPWRPLDPDYITALLDERRIDALLRNRPDPQAPTAEGTLLHVLLRHGLLREIAHAAATLVADETGADLMSLLRDAELVDLVEGAPPTPHWRRQLETTLNATGGLTIREFLETRDTFDGPALAALGQCRASLADLSTLDSEALLHLMQGTLDLSAHRLDAWVTSVATRRLASMRRDTPAGLHVGAYGWVENLSPMPASLSSPVPSPPAGEAGPLQTLANDSGFIHAPSMTHAVTAALLRNAHLGPTGVPDATGPFAIELSSRRVREATRLLDGVRQGQPLGALLGYRVERRLHEARVDNGRSLDRFIAPLRRVAPLVARDGIAPTGPVDTIAAGNVVDGLVLHRRWNEERPVVMAAVTSAGLGTSDLSALSAILDDLGDAIDGLSDALTAESVHQMVRGNTARMASTLAAIAQGDALPPELEVARTPRSGTALTHRLLLLMNTDGIRTPGWGAPDTRPRARTEPMLDAWVSTLLGDGRRIRCTIARLAETTGDVIETRALPLSELGVAPLDVVYGVEAASTTQAGPSLSTLEQLVLHHARHAASGFGRDASLRLEHSRPDDLAVGEITLFDALEQARAVRGLLGVARGAEPEDLNPPERTGQGVIDLAELEARTLGSEQSFAAAHGALRDLAADPTAATDALVAAILELGSFGVEPSVPASVAGEDADLRVALVRQARAMLEVSGPRLERSAALHAEADADDERARLTQLATRLRAVFGDSFVVLPRFTLDASGASELHEALTASTATQGGDPLAVQTWFVRSARVRDGVARMSACLQRAEVLGTGARLDLHVAQLPFSRGDRWVGLPPLPEGTLPPGKLSLVVHTVAPVESSSAVTGLLVDEWVEIVPDARETTALAFQFDAPDAAAPQSILLAVPPVRGEDWTAETLRRVLMETLDLAKLRTVDTASLGVAAQHLPGLYLAFNTEDHAVSTDFAAVTR